jgi:multiple antibiotic resistance protein
MKNELQAFATIFSLVNPAMCATMFLQIEKGRPQHAQIIDATKAVLAIMTVLILAAFLGSQVLHIFGVSLDAFSVAGGAVLAWIGFSMLSGRGSASTPEPEVSSGPANDTAPSLAPIILFAASPGTITGIITISVSHTRFDIPATAIMAIVVVLALTWIILVLTTRFGGSGNGGGIMRDMVTRYMGLIVIAMGIQFVLTGLKSFMGGS